MHAGGREHGAVRVVHVRLGDLVVQLAPSLVERVELGLVLCERPGAAGGPFPRRVRVDLEQHGERPVAELVADRRRLHRAAAERDHGGIGQT